MSIKLYCALAVLLLPILSCSAQPRVSLEQKVARMLIVGFRGTTLEQATTIKEDIVDRGVGGVILFEHNITPVEKNLPSIDILTKLCNDLQALTPRKIMISIDQEGGRVNRMKSKYGFKEMVSQHYLGALNREDSTRYYAGVIANAVSSAGLNTNFTPCVDVNINPESPAIGKMGRSFSDDAALVTKHAMIVIEEHRKRGVLTAVKHFPGHGSSLLDSHLGFTDVSDTWQEKELIPYQTILKEGGCDMVMVSHLFNKRFDDKYPASLSKATVSGLLRDSLHWDGVVITDDMHMKAIAANYGFEESLKLTINAGVDLIILSSNIPGSATAISQQAIDAIVKMVKNGEIPQSRIEESYNRIEKLLGN